MPGPHLCEPSPQRTPFLFQAGTSTVGRKFAATHAEAIFLNGHTPELKRPSVDSIREEASRLGRDPQDIKIVAGLLVVVADSDEAAKKKNIRSLLHTGIRKARWLCFEGGRASILASIPTKRISDSVTRRRRL